MTRQTQLFEEAGRQTSRVATDDPGRTCAPITGPPGRGARFLLSRAPRIEKLELRDGSAVLLRPIHRADVGLLEDGFARLSVQSRRSRFLIAKATLSAAELRYFTDVDHVDHEAIVALSSSDGRGVGVARYVRDKADPYRAELAVTVIDEWQRRGLGSALLANLSRCAQANGIRQFSALAAADNVGVIRLLRRMDADAELVSFGPDVIEYEIFLRPRTACD